MLFAVTHVICEKTCHLRKDMLFAKKHVICEEVCYQQGSVLSTENFFFLHMHAHTDRYIYI